jgi:DNA repair protein RecO (recombination protein O)
MQEFVTDAIVLDIEQTGEYDARVHFFTKELGRISARARSLFKSQSKLAGHLQPLSLVTIRLVIKNGIQVVDAMMKMNFAFKQEPRKIKDLIAVARLIREMTQENQTEPELWSLIEEGDILSKRLLKVMGFDPEHALCSKCDANKPSSFILKDAIYLCSKCILSYNRNLYVSV